jgi:thiamine-monophosphate kinase
VEGIHFDRQICSAADIGHKALAVNLSDIAAMGARPRAALLSLVLPDAMLVADLDALVDGLLELAASHHVALIGGNITRSTGVGDQGAISPSSGPLVINVTAIGSVGRRQVLTRSGARSGDEVYVTGSLGAGAAGLHSLLVRTDQAEATNAAGQHYRRPEPRVRAGMLLGRNKAATACIDLSDGLADAVRQLCGASGTGMLIDGNLVPISDDVVRWCATRGLDALTTSLSGGDDYELLFTVRPSHRGRLRAVRRAVGDLPITRIGTITKDRRVRVVTATGELDLPPGFEHFR